MKKYYVQFTVDSEEMIRGEVPHDDISFSLTDAVEAETEEQAKEMAIQWVKDNADYSRFELIEESKDSIMFLEIETGERTEYIIATIKEEEEFQI